MATALFIWKCWKNLREFGSGITIRKFTNYRGKVKGTVYFSTERCILNARMSKIKNGGLDQYGAEPFEQQQFGTAGVEGVNELQLYHH